MNRDTDEPSGGSDAARAGPPRRDVPPPTRRVTSEELFDQAAELEIDHQGVLYRLRKTSLGKLILTK